MEDVKGKVALVTGGASGIGEAAARALAAAGARVVIGAQHEERAKVVADSIAESGAETLGVGFDTSDEAQVSAGIESIVNAFGGVDILVNNAAITSVDFMMRDAMIHQLDVGLWDQTMAVNLRGYMLCAKHVIPSMLSRGGGVIVNTASGAGMQGEGTRPAYGTSKAAVVGFTRNVATQYGKMGIRCVAVVPGLTMTSTVSANVPAPMLEMMKRHSLTPTLASPEDVAHAIVFLASDRAAFITGTAIPVDGGFSIHSPSYADEAAMYAAWSGAEQAALDERYRRALAARGKASLDADDVALLGELLTDVAVWHGGEAEAGTELRGRDELVRLWNSVATSAQAPKVELVKLYGDTAHIVGVLDITTADGKRTIRQANIFHLNPDGTTAETWSLPPNAAIVDAIASGGPVAEHPNLAPFRAAEEARARNTFGPEDLSIIAGFLREDVHWRSPWGEGPNSRDEVIAQFNTFKQATGDTMALELNDVFADDAHALSLVRLTSDRPDKPERHMDVGEANLFHLDSEGRAYEFWGIADDPAAITSFWAP